MTTLAEDTTVPFQKARGPSCCEIDLIMFRRLSFDRKLAPSILNNWSPLCACNRVFMRFKGDRKKCGSELKMPAFVLIFLSSLLFIASIEV